MDIVPSGEQRRLPAVPPHRATGCGPACGSAPVTRTGTVVPLATGPADPRLICAGGPVWGGMVPGTVPGTVPGLCPVTGKAVDPRRARPPPVIPVRSPPPSERPRRHRPRDVLSPSAPPTDATKRRHASRTVPGAAGGAGCGSRAHQHADPPVPGLGHSSVAGASVPRDHTVVRFLTDPDNGFGSSSRPMGVLVVSSREPPVGERSPMTVSGAVS